MNNFKKYLNLFIFGLSGLLPLSASQVNHADCLAPRTQYKSGDSPNSKPTLKTAAHARALARLFEGIDLLKDYDAQLSREQMAARAELSNYPVQALLSDMLALPRTHPDYSLTVKALSLNRSLISCVQIRSQYPELSHEPEKQKDLSFILRSIQYAAFFLKGNGEYADINRRTWIGRLNLSIEMIEEALSRFRQEHPNETFEIGDFAVSDGISSFELARHFSGQNVKVHASDKLTWLYSTTLPMKDRKYTFFFSEEGEWVQIIDETSGRILPRDSTTLDNGTTKALLLELLKLKKDGVSRLSLIDPEAERYAKEHPDQLEFFSHDIFKPAVQSSFFHFIRISGLLMRGEDSYFQDETIKVALRQLAPSLKPGGLLMNGTFWEQKGIPQGYFDVFERKETALIRVNQLSIGYDSWAGWERIPFTIST